MHELWPIKIGADARPPVSVRFAHNISMCLSLKSEPVVADNE